MKTTKRALFSSVVALILCFSMLVGTTFAWFTDEVTSANNVIVAGNLDIVLEYWDGDSWEDVQGKSDILTNSLWEPGVTEVAYLRVANAGSLALKYQLGINIVSETDGVNAADETFKLSDYIQFGVVEGIAVDATTKAPAIYATREAAVAAVAGAKKLNEGYTKASSMISAQELYLALVVWMPTTVGNEANYKTGTTAPQIDLGINIFATQVTNEEDSFGSDYDKDTAVFTAAEANAMLAENKDVALVDCNDPTGILYVPANYTGTLTLSNVTIASIQESAAATASLATEETTVSNATNIVILGNVVVNATEDGMSAITGTNLNITGSGNLTAIAKGDHAYGIGGANTEAITVTGITIDYVAGGHAYGVGSDTKYYKDAPEGGAAIGSGKNGAVITLKDVTVVEAIGGSKAAAIGANYHTGVTVNITNSIIKYAEGGVSAAGIGSSRVSNGATESGTIINITNSNVTAKGGVYGAGIGSGYDTHCQAEQPLCTINITDSVITATGGQYAAGVGTGYHNAALAGEIKNSTVKATSGEKYYKDSYTAAMDVGFGVVDPTREGQQTDSKLTVEGNTISMESAPSLKKIADGFYFDEEISTYYIENANGLKAFADSVNQYSNYEYPYKDEIVLLMCDIDLGGMEWTPIGDYRFSANRFCGTFDGQGHTISNFQITKKTDKNDSNKSSYGFFGNVEGTVKNLTVANATISSYAYTGALIGRLNGGLVENCHVVASTVAPSYWQGGIMIGQINGGTVKNCTVANSSISGKSALGGISGPVTAESGNILFENCTVKDSAVIQAGSFGGSYDKYFGGIVGYLESGDNRIDLNNCSVINTTVKGEVSSLLSGDNDGNIYVNGVKLITSAAELKDALLAGGDIVLGADIALESVNISNPNFVLDGNGYTITQSGTNTYALIDTQGGSITLKNVTFDGINGGAVVRTVGAKFNAYNVTVQNSNHTQQQGLFRLMGESTIENCVFQNNVCSMAITLNYDGANNDPQIVKNCVFENNTCNSTAVVYYVKGAGCTLDGNKFISNTVNCSSNGATVYMGFTENNVITNNLFKNNSVTDSKTSKRVSGGLMIGYAAEIRGNAFIGNTVSNADGTAKGNNVCASVYYTDIDLSGNYWGGNAPVADVDYYQEYTNNKVIINDYLTTYGE